MPDASYTTKIYEKQGGDTLVIASGGKINIETGGQIVANGTQASAITSLSLSGTYASDSAGIQTAVNSILTALRNAGIIA